MRVRIYGAGSIGNHLAHASRHLGWSVTMCDISQEAIQRTRELIYPSRYGKWDSEIAICTVEQLVKKPADLIIIGTPPDSHFELAMEAIAERPKGVLIEKPLAGPSEEEVWKISEYSKEQGVRVFVGYDHTVGTAAVNLAQRIQSGEVGEPNFIDVSFREHWGGIFDAHPWLDGPADSYLGFWKRGGGATGEHSHGINFWQFLSHRLGAGRIVAVRADIDYVDNCNVDYDDSAYISVVTETGLRGRIVQDTKTTPPIKEAIIGGKRGNITWRTCGNRGFDEVISANLINTQEEKFYKKRPDDFILELQEISGALLDPSKETSLDLKYGLDTFYVIKAAHLSARSGKEIKISYNGAKVSFESI